MRSFAIITAAALLGCGDDPATTPDAPPEIDAPPGPCWPDGARTPRGTGVLGTGRNGFEPMPDMLPLEYGAQDGFMLIAHVRMTGFMPGNPADILDPSNPRTRIHAYFDETNVPLNFYAHCPFRNPYVPSGGEYHLIEAAPVIFETCWRSEHLFGKRIRIEMELLDGDGVGYATDTKIVTAAPPIGFHPIDMGTPGCVH
jgi:hypothetical protein